MKKFKLKLCITILLFFIAQPVLAVPTFQSYIVGGTADSVGEDEDSWFSSDNPLSLIVVGSYSSGTQSLTSVTLALSVLQGETGTITITGGDGAVLLTTTTPVDGGFNPNANADIEILTDVIGNSGYSTKDFLPEPQNNHYPFKDDISDFLIYNLGSFDGDESIHNYNADDGSTDWIANSAGEEKIYTISITGFTSIHFDVYGYETIEGRKYFKSSWEIEPASHDSTYNQIPAPGAIFLGSIGVGVVGWLKRRKAL